MKLRVAAISLACVFAVSPASADELREVLAHAYSSNPSILAARANLRIVNENYAQARSNKMPQVSASASYGYRKTNESGSIFASDDELEPTVAQLNFGQPLYTGGRAPASMRQAKASIQSARYSLYAETQDVIFNGVRAYTTVMTSAEVVEIRRESVRALAAQVDDTEARFDVGEVTRTDVAQARSRYSIARANLSSAQADFQAARASYENVFGFPPMSLEPLPELPPMPESEDQAQQTAIAWNPELVSIRYVEEASVHGVDVARSDIKPRVTLNGTLSRRENLNFAGDEEEAASLTARLEIPIFSGGFERSQIRAAKYQVNRDRLRVKRGERIILEEVTSAWSQWRAARDIVVTSEDATAAAEEALEGIQEEVDYGLRSTFEVLDTELQLRNAQIRLAQARQQQYVAAHRLLSAMGLLTADYLELPIAEFDPDADFNDTKRRLVSTSIEP